MLWGARTCSASEQACSPPSGGGRVSSQDGLSRSSGGQSSASSKSSATGLTAASGSSRQCPCSAQATGPKMAFPVLFRVPTAMRQPQRAEVRVLIVTTGKCQGSTSQRDPDPRLGPTDAPEWFN